MAYSNVRATAIVIQVAVYGARPICPKPPPRHADIIWPLLEKCWAAEPGERMTMAEVVQGLGLPRN